MALVTELLALAAVAGVTVLLVRLLQSYLHFRKLEMAIPGPPSLPLLGNANEFIGFGASDNALETMLRLVDGRRELSRFSLLNHLIVMVQDPAQLQHLLRRKEFSDKADLFSNLVHLIGKKGLVQLNGDQWKAHRKWLAPGFNKNVLDSFVEIFSSEAKGFAGRVVTDKEVDVLDNVRKTITRDFLRTTLTSDPSQFENDIMDVVEFLDVFLHSVNKRTFNPMLWSEHVFMLTALGKKVHRLKHCIDSLSRRMIATKREELADNKRNHDFEKARKTLMDIMIGTSDDGGNVNMGEDDVLDEFKTFLTANVETTVSGLSWMLKILSLEPEVQDQVHAELVSVLGDRDITFKDLPQLKLLDRVVKECLRMFPPVPIIGRQCHAETELCGRVLPAGTTVLLNIHGAHHDPQHWKEPDRFDPDRFLPENCKDRNPCAFMAFSAGNRNCIGSQYAMMSMTTFLATTLRTFRLLPTGDHKDLQSLSDNTTFDITSHLVGGTRVKFQQRGTVGACCTDARSSH